MSPETSHLSEAELYLLDAVTRRIFPGDPTDPGAAEAGVVDYIRSVVDESRSGVLECYRTGLAELDRRAVAIHGVGFTDLKEAHQDAVLVALESEVDELMAAETSTLVENSAAYFFGLVCEHTLHGMFSDPIHGGNRDGIGWRLIGFPGPRWGYSAADMAAGVDASTLPITSLAEVESEARARWGETCPETSPKKMRD
ncbi:MAG: gluconate 2-dehydrogenase subunit 3 family protein [Nocardioides sp.]|uniref:gluconate 2-dehydrogenase subunit 3 family protein n=1 Tax=Nocardioides sp. TaxID=35761 RepID=UPI0039E531DF